MPPETSEVFFTTWRKLLESEEFLGGSVKITITGAVFA
jgi:hypothetical protein